KNVTKSEDAVGLFFFALLCAPLAFILYTAMAVFAIIICITFTASGILLAAFAKTQSNKKFKSAQRLAVPSAVSALFIAIVLINFEIAIINLYPSKIDIYLTALVAILCALCIAVTVLHVLLGHRIKKTDTPVPSDRRNGDDPLI
ncbi:MAG: hypothetical protein K2K28_00700, partial [Clostridia bacterium]|nr:hypothetical protein [Clostridia bacterium]